MSNGSEDGQIRKYLRRPAPFAQFAEPMTAVLADRRELTCSLSAFAAFQQAHFLSTFAAFSSSPKKKKLGAVKV
jgi:hypothetical protein